MGVLSGGSAACAGSVPNSGFDCYGKFSEAWAAGATPSTRLVDWLDPAATGTLIVDGADAIPAVCGDAAVGAGEQCDDGDTANGDGCSSTCEVEDGFTCQNPPVGPSVCSTIVCGNGLVQPEEQCDDGNLAGGDGCSASCDVEPGFSCANDDGQPSACTPVPLGCSENVVPIPDSSSVGASDSVVLPSGGSLLDLDVHIELTHTYVGDLIATLRHEDTGTSAVIIDRPGYTGSGFGCNGSDIDVTLDDAAGTSVEDQCAAGTPTISGTHAPNNPLAAFNGESAGGTWTLTITDNAGQDVGALTGWCALPTGDVPDSDGDGIGDDVDNCTAVANPNQIDADGDGHGNACDADLNNDCVVNPIDLGILRSVFFMEATNADFNGDGVVNTADLGVLRGQFFGPPGPSAAGLCDGTL